MHSFEYCLLGTRSYTTTAELRRCCRYALVSLISGVPAVHTPPSSYVRAGPLSCTWYLHIDPVYRLMGLALRPQLPPLDFKSVIIITYVLGCRWWQACWRRVWGRASMRGGTARADIHGDNILGMQRTRTAHCTGCSVKGERSIGTMSSSRCFAHSSSTCLSSSCQWTHMMSIIRKYSPCHI